MTQRGSSSATVVVVRALRGLGDALCVVPALRHLRRALPGATIRYLGNEEVAGIIGRFGDYVDEFATFPGWPGIPERNVLVERDGVDRCRNADVVVQMHGDGSRMNGFCATLAPKTLVTCGVVSATDSLRVLTRPACMASSEIERCLDLAEDAAQALGAARIERDTALEFPITAEERNQALRVRTALALDGPYVCLHVGSRADRRRWPAERFAAVGRALVKRRVTPVLTGTSAESPLARRVARAIGPSAVDASGLLTVGSLAAWLSEARGLITNDTGISHLAAAVKTSSVVVFMASDPRRWAPLDSAKHRAVFRPESISTFSAGATSFDVPSVSQTLDAARALGIAD